MLLCRRCDKELSCCWYWYCAWCSRSFDGSADGKALGIVEGLRDGFALGIVLGIVFSIVLGSAQSHSQYVVELHSSNGE